MKNPPHPGSVQLGAPIPYAEEISRASLGVPDSSGPGSRETLAANQRQESRMDGHFATIHPFGSSAAFRIAAKGPIALRRRLTAGLPFRG